MSGMFEIQSKLDRVHPLGDQFQTYFAFMNFQTDDRIANLDWQTGKLMIESAI